MRPPPGSQPFGAFRRPLVALYTILSNRCHSFVALGARRVGPTCFDGEEEIEPVLVPLSEMPARVASGEIGHALVVVAFCHLLGLGSTAAVEGLRRKTAAGTVPTAAGSSGAGSSGGDEEGSVPGPLPQVER